MTDRFREAILDIIAEKKLHHTNQIWYLDITPFDNGLEYSVKYNILHYKDPISFEIMINEVLMYLKN